VQKRLRQLAMLALITLTTWSMSPALLLAQDDETAAGDGYQNSFVMAYGVVFLSVGLAVFIISRGSKRSSEVKFDD